MYKRLALCAVFPLLFLADSMPPIKSVSVHGLPPDVHLATQVGQPFDAGLIGDDVHRLWSTGRFTDIRVEAQPDADGTRVLFEASPARSQVLHKILIAPTVPGLQVKVAEGTDIDAFRAHTIAAEAERRLHALGFADAHVTFDIRPFSGHQVDLVLHPEMRDRVKIEEVHFTGDLGFPPATLLGALRQTRVHWLRHPAYDLQAVDADLARLRSLYLMNGYFDARVRLEGVEIEKRALVTIRVNSGPRSTPSPASVGICSSLLAQRRAAERQGIIDFSATLHVPDLSVSVDRGQPYRVGRIEFTGLHDFRDAAARRNLVLDEGQPLDEHLLRKSLARLNRAGMFEPLGAENAVLHPNEKTGVADITIHTVERKRGSWRLSGPVGPASFAGPLEASISARLPRWSSYVASVSLIAFAAPLIPAISIAPKIPLLPLLALTRPFTPGEGWKSGFMIVPQLGWQGSVAAYGTTQLQQRLLPLLAGDSGLEPDLPVTVEGAAEEGVMYCEEPKPRLHTLRTGASVALRLIGILTGF